MHTLVILCRWESNLAKESSTWTHSTDGVMTHYLRQLVVSIESLAVVLVQDAQLPQRVQADQPCTRTDALLRPTFCFFNTEAGECEAANTTL